MDAGDRRHIIQKQVLEFRWAEAGKGRTALDDLNEKFENEIRPGIEKAFERIDSEGQVIRLEKVELDIGTITRDQYEQGFGELISEKLYEHLEAKIPLPENGTIPEEDEVKVIAVTASDTDVLVFFLEMGYFPWWSPFDTNEELTGKIRGLIKTGEEDFRNRMDVVFTDRDATMRLASNVPATVLDDLIRFVYPEIKFGPSKLIEGIIASMGKRKNAEGVLAIGRGYATMLALLSAEAKIKTGELIIRLIREMVPAPFAGERSLPELLERLKKRIETQDINASSELREALGSLVRQISAGQIKIKELKGEEVEKKETRKQKEEEEEKVSKELEKTMVANSGLVLLWPYLEKLFEELKYLEKKRFKSDREIKRAILLLDNLVYRNDEREEHRMLLNKIICGVGTDFLVDLELKLKKKELEEGEKMLEQFIDHWKKLKNTSPDGLREAFLKREGSLDPDGENWKLTVERKSIDVLMGALPFQVSMIKLPWMSNMIFVEW